MRLKELFDLNTGKVFFATVGTALDITIARITAVAFLLYVLLKLWRLWKGREKP